MEGQKRRFQVTVFGDTQIPKIEDGFDWQWNGRLREVSFQAREVVFCGNCLLIQFDKDSSYEGFDFDDLVQVVEVGVGTIFSNLNFCQECQSMTSRQVSATTKENNTVAVMVCRCPEGHRYEHFALTSKGVKCCRFR